MMQLITIASFLVLLCDIFGRVAAENTITTYDMNIPVTDNKLIELPGLSITSCEFGVKKVSVFMFTSDIPQREFINISETCNLINSPKVIFLSHGFLLNATSYNFSDLAAKLVQNGYVVYSIDWSQAACSYMPLESGLLLYPFAVNNTREVGRRLANMMKSLIDGCKVPLSNISCLGHSLGAHVCGFAGKNLQKSDYGKCPLILGLDPAAPLFESKECPDRLCKEDATHVTVIHSSPAGLQYSMGSCDFWMNNGLGQPACGELNDTIRNNYFNLSKDPNFYVDEIISNEYSACSHLMSIKYVIIMLENCFIGILVPPRSDPSLEPGCSSNTTNCTFVDKRIYDKDYNATGDYCVPVIAEDPYYTTTNSTCQ